MMERSIASLLTEETFFHGLSSEFIAFLAVHAAERKVAKGEILFEHGQHADRFYLLRDGRITIEVPAISGPALEVQSLGAGQVLGWSWLIPPYKWSFQARAMQDTDVLEFDGRATLERCESDPRFGYEMMKRFSALMSERLEAARAKIMEEWNPPGFA